MASNRFTKRNEQLDAGTGRYDIFDKLGLCFREDGTAYIDRQVSSTTRLLYGDFEGVHKHCWKRKIK